MTAQRSRQAALSGSQTKAPGFAGGYLLYATDLADTPGNREKLAALARDAHTFFCEAPFVLEHAQQAKRTGHLTARACGEIATLANVQHLIPFHFSQRYKHSSERVYAEVALACSRSRH